MNIKKLARYFIWQLPNSKAIPIAEFISILENNLNLAYEELQWRKHKSWSVITDYVEVLSFLHSQDTWTLWFLLKYYDLPKDFICKIDFSEHIIKCTGWSSDWLKSISDSLEGMNETDFSRFIVMPILQQMGYEEISYKWKVNSTDYWNDFFQWNLFLHEVLLIIYESNLSQLKWLSEIQLIHEQKQINWLLN